MRARVIDGHHDEQVHGHAEHELDHEHDEGAEKSSPKLSGRSIVRDHGPERSSAC
jgi:hypothetical protein